MGLRNGNMLSWLPPKGGGWEGLGVAFGLYLGSTVKPQW